MKAQKTDGIYFYWDGLAGGMLVVVGTNVLSYPLWGSKRELFERWREGDLRISLAEMHTKDLYNAE